ncbi:DUF3261 domain-containing protein [Nannocystaceae bacterium ST9]
MSVTTRVAALVSLALLGCQHGRGQTSDEGSEPIIEREGSDPEGQVAAKPGYPGTLIDTSELGGDFVARQKLHGKFGEQEFRFEAVMQLRNGALTVIGLTPFGSKAFVLVQTGTEVEFQPLMDRPMPFPPEYMLQDIHRTWFWHARLPWDDGPPSDEAPQAEVEGERIVERWSGGKLVRRSFERLDGAPAGVLRIDYIGGHRTGKPAAQVVIENAWFGYRLEIETAEWRAL